MCNPRRVTINLNEHVEEAWRENVEQTAAASEEVGEIAQISTDIQLDDELGGTALQMLERVLTGEFEGFEAWEQADGQYRRQLDDVTLVYDPKTHRLNIETRLTETISAQTTADAEASGFTVGEIVVEALGNYYEDGWGGRTKERASNEAQQEAERKLANAAQQLRREQNREAFDAAEGQAQAEAQTRLEAKMEQLRQETRAALRERLQITLAHAQDGVQEVLNRAIGEAYRQTLLQIVKENGGRVLTDEQTGSVINMELELY